MAILACISLLSKLLTVVEVVLIAGVIGIFLNSLYPNSTIDTSSDESKKELSNSQNDKSIISRSPEKRLALIPLLCLALPVLPLLGKLALIFFRIGAITFGGGFVMIPLIEQEVVNHYHWLSHQQFVDGMALGQITPGPVLITATFIGYYVAGFFGAIVATIAVFLPSILTTIIIGHPLERVRTNPQVQAFLNTVTPTVVGMMAASVVKIGEAGIHSVVGISLATTSCLILLKWRTSPALVMLGAAILGIVLKYLLPVYSN
jgi:chromate transporter